MIQTISKRLKHKLYAFWDMIFYKFTNIKKHQLKSEPVIIYICETNMPRLGRMLKYLSKIRDERMHVYVKDDKFFNQFSYSDNRIQYFTYRSRYQLKYLLSNYSNIKLIHGLESRSVYPSVGLDFKQAPFIFDFQDLYNIYFDKTPKIKWIRENLIFEKKCLEQASAYISYSLELIPARKKLEIKTKNVLYFPFYLDDEFCNTKESIKNDRTIRLVYAGGISSIEKQDSFNLTLLNRYIKGTNIYIHIFPSPSSPNKTIEDYKEFSTLNPNIVMEQSVSQKELSDKLNQYDFGFIPFYKTEGFLSDTKFKYSTTLKLFNYIEAGLPLLLFDYTEYQSWIVNHNKIGISLKKENLDSLPQILNEIDYETLVSNVKNFQTRNKLSQNIYKISNLYNKVIKEHQQ